MDQDPSRPKRISDLALSIADHFGEKQREHAQIAQDYGYSRETLEILANNYSNIPDQSIFAETELSLLKFNTFIREKELNAKKFQVDVASASYAIATTSASTASLTSSLTDNHGSFRIPDPPPHRSPNRIQDYADRLTKKLDPELGKLMRSAWQAFYAGTENDERAALLSMRQLYDQFFELLAPDDAVRNSNYFQLKDGDKPNQVHRKERLNYVANVRAKDANLADFLQAEVDQVIKLYNELNLLHSRITPKRKQVKGILESMQAVIELWVDAVEL